MRLHIHWLSILLVIPLYFEHTLRVDRALNQFALNVRLLNSAQLLTVLSGGLVLDSPFVA